MTESQKRKRTMHRTKLVLGLLLPMIACGPGPAEVETAASSSTTAMPSTDTSTAGTPNAVTSTADATTDGVDDGVAFLVCPEVCIPDYECEILTQNCPRGQKCAPYANDGSSHWNATHCVPIADDPRASGEPCTMVGSVASGEDDCDGTSMCWYVDHDTHEGSCVAFCTGTVEAPGCPDPCFGCSFSSEEAIYLCFDPCDPLIQDCPPGQACHEALGTFSFVCTPNRSELGAGTTSPCGYFDWCPQGMACVDSSAVPGCDPGIDECCTPFCAVGEPDPCPELVPGSSCVPLPVDPEPPEGCTTGPVGVCRQ